MHLDVGGDDELLARQADETDAGERCQSDEDGKVPRQQRQFRPELRHFTRQDQKYDQGRPKTERGSRRGTEHDSGQDSERSHGFARFRFDSALDWAPGCL